MMTVAIIIVVLVGSCVVFTCGTVFGHMGAEQRQTKEAQERADRILRTVWAGYHSADSMFYPPGHEPTVGDYGEQIH